MKKTCFFRKFQRSDSPGSAGLLLTISWCQEATFPHSGICGVQLASLPTSPNCPPPHYVIHLHDLWAHAFLIPAIDLLSREMSVYTKFTVKIQRYMELLVEIICYPALQELGWVTYLIFSFLFRRRKSMHNDISSPFLPLHLSEKAKPLSKSILEVSMKSSVSKKLNSVDQ